MRRALVALLLCCLFFPLAAAAQGGPSDSALRPGDLVELHVLRDTTLSGRFPVEESGRVVLPLLGPRAVAGEPWSVLRDALVAAYGRELSDAAVRITPLRRIFVLGFVQEPGAYYADPTVTIAGAIALAGGASSEGDLRRIRLLRDGNSLFQRVAIDDARIAGDVHSGDQIFVDRRGWFDRNSPFFVSALVSVASIVVTLIVVP